MEFSDEQIVLLVPEVTNSCLCLYWSQVLLNMAGGWRGNVTEICPGNSQDIINAQYLQMSL